MNNGPLIRQNLHELGIDPTVRRLVFDAIERLHPREYRTWWRDGVVYYGAVDDVPPGVTSSFPIGALGLVGQGMGADDDRVDEEAGERQME